MPPKKKKSKKRDDGSSSRPPYVKRKRGPVKKKKDNKKGGRHPENNWSAKQKEEYDNMDKSSDEEDGNDIVNTKTTPLTKQSNKRTVTFSDKSTTIEDKNKYNYDESDSDEETTQQKKLPPDTSSEDNVSDTIYDLEVMKSYLRMNNNTVNHYEKACFLWKPNNLELTEYNSIKDCDILDNDRREDCVRVALSSKHNIGRIILFRNDDDDDDYEKGFLKSNIDNNGNVKILVLGEEDDDDDDDEDNNVIDVNWKCVVGVYYCDSKCDSSLDNFVSCGTCPWTQCNTCFPSSKSELFLLSFDDDVSRPPSLTCRCESCIDAVGLLPQEARDAADAHIKRSISRLEEELEEMLGQKKKKTMKKKKGMRKAPPEGGVPNADEIQESSTEPNPFQVQKALSSGLFRTRHNLKVDGIRDRLAALFPAGKLDKEKNVEDYLHDKKLQDLGKSYFDSLKAMKPGSKKFGTISIASIAPVAIPFLRLLHTQHCTEDDCKLCRPIVSVVEKSSSTLGKRSREAIELYDTSYSIAKEVKASDAAQAYKRATKATKKAQGSDDANFGYRESMTDENSKCPVCEHSLLQFKYTEAKLTSMNKKRQEEHDERLAEYDQEQPNIMQNPAKRPRRHQIPQEFKCACRDVSGTYCPECGGKDEDCGVCNCQCTAGWMPKKDFQLISAQAQAAKNNMEENEAPKTVEQNLGVFASMLQQSMANSAAELSHMGEEITMDSLAGNAARFVAESELDEGVQHAVAEQMGAPTEMLGGDKVSTYQAGSVGHRFYGNNLGARSGRTGSFRLQQGPPARARQQHQQHQTAAPPPAAAASAAASLPVQRDPEGFEKRIVQKIVSDPNRDPTATRRNKRVLNDIATKKSDGNMTRMIMGSFDDGVESPAKGKSQEAVDSMLRFSKTPDKPEEEHKDGEGDMS